MRLPPDDGAWGCPPGFPGEDNGVGLFSLRLWAGYLSIVGKLFNLEQVPPILCFLCGFGCATLLSLTTSQPVRLADTGQKGLDERRNGTVRGSAVGCHGALPEGPGETPRVDGEAGEEDHGEEAPPPPECNTRYSSYSAEESGGERGADKRRRQLQPESRGRRFGLGREQRI
eukprot:GHVT01097109.1.p1 GENE.GHVT01097109.1~~GHVT01097109.1.p1  ORF type:complete len:172 (-),score=33.73 GHVT01097109.1:46-561(-)